MKDTLTGLGNQSDLLAQIEATPHPKLFVLDIDDFRDINLNFGDIAGDFILTSFAKALQDFTAEHSLQAYRIKDDTFGLLANMPFDLPLMEQMVFAIRDFCDYQSYEFQGETININFHMGVCLDQFDILPKALKALELAQKQDQSFVTYADFVNTMLKEDEQELVSTIQKSVQDGLVFPAFQKILDESGNVHAYEVLMRMDLGGSIQWPKLFLHVAKEHGLYGQILEQFLEKIPKTKAKLSINVSKEDIEDKDIFTLLTDRFANSNAIFEIQSFGSQDPDEIMSMIRFIHAKNIQVCLDNIRKNAELKPYEKSNVDYVKVSGSTIRQLGVNLSTRQACSTLLASIQKMGAKSIAAHINSTQNYEHVNSMGFDFYQGFMLHKPSERL